ncbi:MAG: HEAT repeat domain-containing protein [Candidatus Hydrogenedentes bacterium]|nr:HEAT repeat domain-containing protein [Candidatus Hydrogenedentota bacterium]
MTRSTAIAAFGLVLLSATARAESPTGLESITVPEGFTVELAATPGLSSYPMFMEFDEAGNLYTAESTGSDMKAAAMIANPSFMILRLSDTDKDGVYDSKSVFADKLTFPMGVLCHQGSVYVSAPPDLVRLKDTDQDGVADEREVILTGWNMRNSASLHGPFLGPDGWLYLTHGRHGYDITTKEGERLQGEASRIWRCRPDGTQLERMAGGAFDNPVEIIFTPAGETIGTMTYFRDPAQGQRDALMHWVEGGVFPKPGPSMSEFVRTGPLLPTMTKFARIAPAGLVRFEGAVWGEEYTNNLFSAQFNPHRVQRHKLFRDGATYRTEDSDFLTSSHPDFHPTDVMQDADGSLLVCDTGGWYVDACPVSRISKPEIVGGIYRVRKADATPVADPWGRDLGLGALPVEELVHYLGDERPQVRCQAFSLLIAQGEGAVAPLAELLKLEVEDKKREAEVEAQRKASGVPIDEEEEEEHGGPERLYKPNPALSGGDNIRLQAVWAIGQLGGEDAGYAIRFALRDENPDIRIAAARISGLTGDRDAGPALTNLLFDPEPAVRRQAASSLGSLRAIESVFPLYMAAAHAVDPFETHAITMAAIQMHMDKVAKNLLKHTNPRIQSAAAISLDQMGKELIAVDDVLPLLASRDDSLRETALFIASRHSEWSERLLEQMTGVLRSPSFEPGSASGLRSILLTYATSGPAQEAIAGLLSDAEIDTSRKLFLLEIVEAAPLDKLPEAWISVLGTLIAQGPEELRWPAVGLVQSRNLAEHDAILAQQAADAALPIGYRLHALSTIAGRMPELDPASAELILGVLKDREGDPALRQSAGRILAASHLSDAQLFTIASDILSDADVLTVPNLLKAFNGKQDPAVGQALVASLGSPSFPAHMRTPAILEPVLAAFPEEVRAAAEPLLAQQKAEEEARVAKLLDLEPLAMSGDVGRGRRVFFGEKAACYTCHAIGDEGGHLGPDLTTVGVVRTSHDILESVLFPNASLVQDYETYTVETDWQTYDGIIARQDNDAITLKTGVGEEVRINRSDITSMTPSPISKMPEGLDLAISREELIDLITFLKSLNNDDWLIPVARN